MTWNRLAEILSNGEAQATLPAFVVPLVRLKPAVDPDEPER